MAWDGVEKSGARQAENGANEEEEKDQFVHKVDVVVTVVAKRLHVEHDRRDQKSHESDQMCPKKLAHFYKIHIQSLLLKTHKTSSFDLSK